jgi:hypothetical protein
VPAASCVYSFGPEPLQHADAGREGVSGRVPDDENGRNEAVSYRADQTACGGREAASAFVIAATQAGGQQSSKAKTIQVGAAPAAATKEARTTTGVLQ